MVVLVAVEDQVGVVLVSVRLAVGAHSCRIWSLSAVASDSYLYTSTHFTVV